MPRFKAAFFSDDFDCYKGNAEHVIDYVFRPTHRERIAAHAEMYPEIISAANFDSHAEALSQIDFVFATWGMPCLSEEQIGELTQLKAVLYAAGATRQFREPYLKRGVRVITGARANAIPVAEFCHAIIILSMKGFFRNAREAVDADSLNQVHGFRGSGSYGGIVSVIGGGAVSGALRESLKTVRLDVRLYEPGFNSVDRAQLAEHFSEAMVVSNHLPNIPQTRGVIDESLFRCMPEGATFINTGRGAQVNHADLIRVFKDRSDLTAILDVQQPEPPPSDSALYQLDNVIMTSHLAGASNDEVARITDYVLDDFERFIRGHALEYEVDMMML